MRKSSDRERTRAVVAATAICASVILVILLPQRDTASTAALLALSLAILLLDFFDLSLPHGDRIGLEGPLIAAGLLVVSPVPVMAIGLVARAVAWLATSRRAGLEESLVDLSTAGVGIAAASATTHLVLVWGGQSGGAEYIAVGFACAALLIAQLLYSQALSALRLHRPFRGLLLGNMRFQGPLLLAEMSTSVLLVMTYERMGVWAFVLAVVLLLLLRHSYALLIDVRQAYMSTVEVLVETAESADPRREGHSERTAELARQIAEELGLGSGQVERLSYAALVHDLDMVRIDPDGASDVGAVRHTGRLLGAVGFLSEVVPVLKVLDGDPGMAGETSAEQRMLALIVAVASDVDSREHGVPLSGEGDVVRVASLVGPVDKSKVVAAALRLGHSIPAVP
jgi:HD domain